MNIQYAFELAIQNELDMRDLYLELSKKFKGNADLSDMWSRMADSESGHAVILTKLRNSLSQPQLRREIDVDVKPMESFRMKVHEFRQRVNTNGLSSDQIFETVVDLELGEQEDALLELLNQLPQPIEENARQNLVGPVERHLKALLESIEKESKNKKLLERVRQLRRGL